MNRRSILGIFATLVVLNTTAIGSVQAAVRDDCATACMRLVLDQYLQAVFKHDPTAAPLSKRVKGTENAAPLTDGGGIWRTASGYGDVQRRYFDTDQHTAVYFGLLKEGDDDDIVSVRIKIRHKKITEEEWTVARKGAGGLFSVDGLRRQPPPSDTPIRVDDRVSRAKLVAAADRYFDGLELHDGSAIPHIPGCDRIENGTKVTNRPLKQPLGATLGGVSTPNAVQETPRAAGGATTITQETRSGDCASGFDMFKTMIAHATHRRYPMVDVEAGVVIGTTIFHRPPGATMKRNLLTEYFWERKGRISAIYAAMYYMDPMAPDTSGWDSSN